MTPRIYLGRSGLRLERVNYFDAVSLTANPNGFVTGRAVAGWHIQREQIRATVEMANRREEVGIVTGNFDALVVPKSTEEHQRSVGWARAMAEDLLGALKAVEARTLWMTHFMWPKLSATMVRHILGIIDTLAKPSENSTLENVLIDVPIRSVSHRGSLRREFDDVGWELEEQTRFLMEPLYRIRTAQSEEGPTLDRL